jgi:hypothetical protein
VDADFEGVGELGCEGGELPLSVRRDSTGDDEADLVFGTLGVKGTKLMEASTKDTAIFEADMHGSCLDEGKGWEGRRRGAVRKSLEMGPRYDGDPEREAKRIAHGKFEGEEEGDTKQYNVLVDHS